MHTVYTHLQHCIFTLCLMLNFNELFELIMHIHPRGNATTNILYSFHFISWYNHNVYSPKCDCIIVTIVIKYDCNVLRCHTSEIQEISEAFPSKPSNFLLNETILEYLSKYFRIYSHSDCFHIHVTGPFTNILLPSISFITCSLQCNPSKRTP